MTAAQEAILEQIIEAFQNGKRLSDLPDVSGTNPFNLICEVLEDGESKKAALATLLPYMEEECSYGIEFDTAVSSPACTRIGNLSLHKSLPIHNRMKGCLLNDDGEVVEYLNPAIGRDRRATARGVRSWSNFPCTTANSRLTARSGGYASASTLSPAIVSSQGIDTFRRIRLPYSAARRPSARS